MPRVFPHDLEAERSLLGSMLISKEACQDILNKCEDRDFMKNHIKYYSMQWVNFRDKIYLLMLQRLTSYLLDHSQFRSK